MSQSDYSRLDRLLHRFALGNGFISKASFEVETLTSKTPPADRSSTPVYIAGLARSGSTILLNALYQTGGFRSLTYRDMPFILMPGLWQRLSASSHIEREARERAHGDRLMVAYDSPEAFEEVFWRTFLGSTYISSDCVRPHQVPASVRSDYRKFVGNILGSADNPQQTRYLCKNNNNLLRLPTLRKMFPQALLLVPFRHPLQQAASLYKQHVKFSELHQPDKFSKQYMEWLGHFEFGLGQKHYLYADNPPVQQRSDLNYWIQSWIDAYTFALRDDTSNLVFVGYEPMCEDPAPAFERLFELGNIHSDPSDAAAFYEAAGTSKQEDVDRDLLGVAEALYKELLQKHRESLG